MTDENERKGSIPSLMNKRSDSPENTHEELEEKNNEIKEGTKDDEQMKQKSGTDDYNETKKDEVDEPAEKERESKETPQEGKNEPESREREQDGGDGSTNQKVEDGESTKVETITGRKDETENEDGNEENKEEENLEYIDKGKDDDNTKEEECEKKEVKEEGHVDATVEKDSSNQGQNDAKKPDPECVEDEVKTGSAEVIKPDNVAEENKTPEESEVNEGITENEREEKKPEDTGESSVENKEEPGSGLIDEGPGGEGGLKESPGEKEVIDAEETRPNVLVKESEDLTSEEKVEKSDEGEGNGEELEKKGSYKETKSEGSENENKEIDNGKDLDKEKVGNEISGSATKEIGKEGDSDKEKMTTEQAENGAEEKTDENECSGAHGGEKRMSISTSEDGKIDEPTKANEHIADEGSGNVNESEETKGNEKEGMREEEVEKSEKAPEVLPQEPNYNSPNKDEDNTTATHISDHKEGQQELDSKSQNNGERKNAEDGDDKGTEVDQPSGPAELTSVLQPEIEGQSGDGDEQSENISEDPKTFGDTGKSTEQVDGLVKKTIPKANGDERNEEPVPEVADENNAECLDEVVSDEKPEENKLASSEKDKELDHPNQLSTDTEDLSTCEITPQKDTPDSQESSSSVKNTDKNANQRTEQRMGSGTIYRVQTDYLTRQVIAKQEKETYLEEKLSETTRDLEIAERKVKDLQLRLKRFVKDDEVKDSKIRQMEQEYKDLAEQMRMIEESLDSKSRNNNLGEIHNESLKQEQKKRSSKVCVIL